MSYDDTLELLRGASIVGVAFGATWLNDVLGERVDDVQVIAEQAQLMSLDFIFVDADRPGAASACAALIDVGIVPVWVVAGVVGRVAGVQGWPQLMRTSALTPSELAAPFAQALHTALDEIRAGVAAGAVAVLIADDLSSSAGWLVSPDFALDAAVPCYYSMAGEIIRSAGVALFHSDGDIRALFGSLARAGFSGVHLAGLTEKSLADAIRCARAIRLTPLGGIGTGALQEVETAREAGRQAARYAPEGPLLLCDDGGLTSPSELVNLGQALAAARVTLGYA